MNSKLFIIYYQLLNFLLHVVVLDAFVINLLQLVWAPMLDKIHPNSKILQIRSIVLLPLLIILDHKHNRHIENTKYFHNTNQRLKLYLK